MMQLRLLKLSIFSAFALLLACFGLTHQTVQANRGGPPAARTGAPGELTCAISGCHTGSAINSGTGMLTITGLPANGYTAGQEVNVTVTMAHPARIRFGFQLTAIDDQGRAAGTFTITDTARTQLISGTIGNNLRRYVQHNTSGSSASSANQGMWTFRWTPPATTTGRVTFYVAGNAANNDGDDTGDLIYTTSASVQPAAALASVAAVSAASFTQNAPLAANAIAALFGSNLAADVAIATTTPLPTDLGGVKVRVKDSANVEKDAALFFVAPSQLNFEVPAGLANGAGTITVLRNNVAVAQGPITLEATAPGVFTANANGQGVAAADVLRVKADGTQIYEAVARRNAANTAFEPKPIELGPATEAVFLILYGTGIRNNGGLNNVTATIGGEAAEVFFAGAQGLTGLDQVNLRIPRSLSGRGVVNVVLTVNGKVANTVTIQVQ